MAKMYGFSGKVSGKKGDTVFSVRKGEQVLRQYNPIVANPATMPQVNARARMKLSSQLAAVLANVIAIRPEGAKSARNLFTQVNYPAITAQDGEAEIKLEDIQLTKSNRSFGDFSVSRETNAVQVSVRALPGATRAVAVLLTKRSNGELMVAGSATATLNDGGSGVITLPATALECAVLCFSETDLSGRATAAFANLTSPTGEDVARVIGSRSISEGDVQISQTAGVYLAVGEDSGDTGGNA